MVTGCEKPAPSPPEPPDVYYTTVSPTQVPLYEEWIGSLDGFVNAQIRAQVTGYLLSQNYTEGGEVRKGDLLFQIDPRPFQAALDQAEAKMAQDQAQSSKTNLDVQRYTPLAKEQAISEEELDNAVQANLGAIAQIKADEAAIKNARLNLDFTRITSPIDGLAGLAMAQIGDLVGQSGTVLTTVSTIDPIKVYFQVSEHSYLSFWRQFIEPNQSTTDCPLELILRDGSVYEEKGKFYFADREINSNTGTLQIVGLFPNPKYVLRPGQYGRVRALTETKTNVLVVPQRAVSEQQNSYQIAVIDPDNKIHLQTVEVGEETGSNWIITKGLKPNDRVVIEGSQNAKEGIQVNPKPFIAEPESQSGASSGGDVQSSPENQ